MALQKTFLNQSTNLSENYDCLLITLMFFISSIACPPCYNDIKTLVTRMRTNIRKLVRFIQHFNLNSTGALVVDLDFEAQLRELTSAVNSLLDKAETSNLTDRHLQQQLEILDRRVGAITEVLSDVKNGTDLTEAVMVSAIGDISDAEESINRSRTLLDEAEKLLVEEGVAALNESIHAANRSSEHASRMEEILNEVLLKLLFIFSQNRAQNNGRSQDNFRPKWRLAVSSF